jgi:hypothetical protein
MFDVLRPANGGGLTIERQHGIGASNGNLKIICGAIP